MIQFAERLGVTPAYFVDGIAGGSKGDAAKNARAIDSVAATDEGVAMLEAMAQMKPTQIHGDAGASAARHGVSEL